MHLRRATFGYGWIKGLDHNFLTGIALGYDFSAEHEWGASVLKTAFGLPDELTDFDSHRMSYPPKIGHVFFDEQTQNTKARSTSNKAGASTHKVASLGFVDYWPDDWLARPSGVFKEALNHSEATFHAKPGDWWYRPQHDIATAWSNRAFLIRVRGEKNCAHLKEIHQALVANDLYLLSGQSKYWPNLSGLVLLVGNRISASARKDLCLAKH